MDTRQLSSLIASSATMKKHFRGVFAKDTMPKKPKDYNKPCSYICNLDPSTKPGSHWICIYYPKPPNHPEYFDSFGFDGEQFKNFLGETYFYNANFLQFPFSAVCGQYCIYYLYQRSLLKSMHDVLEPFQLDDQLYNDFYVNNFIENKFSINLDVFDTDFVINQINTSYKQQEYIF